MYNLLLSLITLVIISFIFLHLNAKNKILQNKLNSMHNEIINTKSNTSELHNNKEKMNVELNTSNLYNNTNKNDTLTDNEINEFNKSNPIIERDYRVVYDQLIPAVQRPPIYVFPPNKISQYIDIPTRGLPDNYQYMGNLVRSSDEKIIKLFGS